MESITFTRAVKKDGSSLIIFMTKEVKLLDGNEGSIMEVTIRKIE